MEQLKTWLGIRLFPPGSDVRGKGKWSEGECNGLQKHMAESIQMHVREADSMEEMGAIIFTVAPRAAIQQACQP